MKTFNGLLSKVGGVGTGLCLSIESKECEDLSEWWYIYTRKYLDILEKRSQLNFRKSLVMYKRMYAKKCITQIPDQGKA